MRAAGDLTGAVARYREALKHVPDYATAHHNLGVALLQQKKRAEATESFEEAARCDPKLVFPLLELVGLYAANDLPRALATARRAVAADERSADAHAVHGKVLFALNRVGDARAAFARAAALKAEFGNLLKLLPPPAVAPPPRAK